MCSWNREGGGLKMSEGGRSRFDWLMVCSIDIVCQGRAEVSRGNLLDQLLGSAGGISIDEARDEEYNLSWQLNEVG